MITKVEDYSFKVQDLNLEKRKKGLSMFIRTRNGEDFLEEAIESHIEFLDELVVVYNRCTDGTEKILKKLMKKHRQKPLVRGGYNRGAARGGRGRGGYGSGREQ